MSFPISLPASRIEAAAEAQTLRWGILGSGWIAERFIESVRAHTKQDIVAVGSRTEERAAEFASRVGLEQAFGDYEELVAADDLDGLGPDAQGALCEAGRLGRLQRGWAQRHGQQLGPAIGRASRRS